MTEPTLSSFDPVAVTLPAVVVDPAEVDQRISEMLAKIPVYGEGGGEAAVVAREDRICAKIELFENGEPLPGFDGTERTITVVDGFLPAGLVEGLIGMEEGQRREFTFEMPAIGASAEDEEQSSMRAVVEVTAVKKRTAPALDDAWVEAHVPQAHTVEGLRELVHGQLSDEARRKREGMKRALCAAVLSQRLQGDLPAEALERGVAGVRARFEQGLAAKGMERERYLVENGLTEDALQADLEAQGRQAAREGLALELFARHLGLEVTEEDIDASFGGRTAEERAAARARYEEAGGSAEKLHTIALCGKALDTVVEQAVVTEVDAPPTRPFVDPFK